MAFPVVLGTPATTSGASTTTPIVNLPASIIAGETLLVVLRGDNWGAGTVPAFPAGWTTLLSSQADNSDDATVIGWRLADGAEGATVTFVAGTNAGKFSAISYRISGATDPTVTPPDFSNTDSSADGDPDSPILTPAAGAKDYLWFSIATYEGESTSPPTYPTDYTGNQVTANSGTGGLAETNNQVAGASRALNATSQDPGAYAIATNDAWTGSTIAFHPRIYPALIPDQPQARYYSLERAQQPDSFSAPVFVPAPEADTFFEAWHSNQARFYPKAVAQQPPSEAGSPFPLPETYFEAWRSTQERYYPKAVAQQPPGESAPVLAETPPVEPIYFDASSVQVFARRWAQQPPSESQLILVAENVTVSPEPTLFQFSFQTTQYPAIQQPIFFEPAPVVPTWFETNQAQVFPLERAQQPPSETKPVAIPDTYFEAWHSNQVRFYPKATAQQPPSLTAPVFVPATWFETTQEQVWPLRRAQQPPSNETKPVATIPETYFEAWENRQERFYPKAVAQQPDSLVDPILPMPAVLILDAISGSALLTNVLLSADAILSTVSDGVAILSNVTITTGDEVGIAHVGRRRRRGARPRNR
jgi:hypothetical protein